MAPRKYQTESDYRNERQRADDIADERYESSSTKLAVMANDIKYMKDKVDVIQQQISTSTVSIDQFKNLQYRVSNLEKAVYGTLALIIASLVGIGIRAYLNFHNTPIGK